MRSGILSRFERSGAKLEESRTTEGESRHGRSDSYARLVPFAYQVVSTAHSDPSCEYTVGFPRFTDLFECPPSAGCTNVQTPDAPTGEALKVKVKGAPQGGRRPDNLPIPKTQVRRTHGNYAGRTAEVNQFHSRHQTVRSQGITTTAHKLARIIYQMVTTGHAYDETICAQNEVQNRQRRKLDSGNRPASSDYRLLPYIERSSSDSPESSNVRLRLRRSSSRATLSVAGYSWRSPTTCNDIPPL
jgi:hypothetical protein